MYGSTSERSSHKRIDDLFANPISADEGANYVKHLFIKLSTLSPYISGSNSVKQATPLDQCVYPSFRGIEAFFSVCLFPHWVSGSLLILNKVDDSNLYIGW